MTKLRCCKSASNAYLTLSPKLAVRTACLQRAEWSSLMKALKVSKMVHNQNDRTRIASYASKARSVSIIRVQRASLEPMRQLKKSARMSQHLPRIRLQRYRPTCSLMKSLRLKTMSRPTSDRSRLKTRNHQCTWVSYPKVSRLITSSPTDSLKKTARSKVVPQMASTELRTSVML